MHVASRTESFSAETFCFALTFGDRAVGTGEDYNADAWVFAADGKSLAHLADGKGSKGIAIARTVDGDTGNTFVKIKEYFLKCLYRGPNSHLLLI